MIMLYLVFSFGLTYAMHSMTVYALFSDKVTYRWASISAKAQIDCKNDHDDDEDDIDQCTKKPKQPKLIANLHDQNKLLNFKVQHISQFVTLQYQIVYDTDHGHQGISGNVELHTDKKYEKKDIVLGTCSSGVCIYHKDVHDVVIRVTLTDANGESTKLQLVLEKRHEHDEDDGF